MADVMPPRIQQLFCLSQQVLLGEPQQMFYAAVVEIRLGKRIRQIRKLRDLTQEELVAMVPGSSQAQLSALEKRNSITTTLLFEYAKALAVNPRWLLTGLGDRDIDPLQYQLMDVYEKLSPDGRDEMLGSANRIYSKEHPEDRQADPFPIKAGASKKTTRKETSP